MAKHTLKIMRCEQGKIFKDVWPFFKIMHERINSLRTNFSLHFNPLLRNVVK